MEAKKFFEDFSNKEFFDGLVVKKIVNFKGRGGMPLVQGKLYFGNKHIADISEDYSGGALNVDIFDIEKMNEIYSFLNEKNYDSEWYFYDLLTTFDLLGMAKRKKSKTIVYRVKTFEVVTYNQPYSEKIEKYITSQKDYDKSNHLIINRYL